jgi:hypothetical protein
MGNLKLQPLTADPDKPAKKICVKTEKFFGKFLEKASGVFMRGRLSGEATIGTSKDEQYFVNFVKGVPHGRIRYLKHISLFTIMFYVFIQKIRSKCVGIV